MLKRMDHLLANQPDNYIWSTPIIIPVQGELHGAFHSRHSLWRQYKRFLLRCADEIGNVQIKEDPTVSDLNVTRFFQDSIVTRAAARISILRATQLPTHGTTQALTWPRLPPM